MAMPAQFTTMIMELIQADEFRRLTFAAMAYKLVRGLPLSPQEDRRSSLLRKRSGVLHY